MDFKTLPVIAGTVSTIIFAASQFPMLIKAAKTKDLHSYSFETMLLCNVGNILHWLYISALPFGPIWFLHSFSTVTTAMMLIWYVRYRSEVH